MGVRADDQPAGIDAARRQPVQFFEQDGQVDDDPVTDNRGDSRRQDA